LKRVIYEEDRVKLNRGMENERTNKRERERNRERGGVLGRDRGEGRERDWRLCGEKINAFLIYFVSH
jgi:hypothetical protein